MSPRALRALGWALLRMTMRGRASQAFAGAMAGRPLGMLWLFGLYIAVGAATVPAALAGADAFTYALLTQAITWTLCGVSLTAEAGDALFQPDERDVLGHRPVEARTILTAKALVLLAFVSALALAINAGPAIAIARRGGVGAALAHLAVILAAIAVLTTAIVALYATAARVVRRERFDDVAAASQVVLAIAFVAITMVLGRVVWGAGGMHVDPTRWAVRWLPPAWFAALESVLTGVAMPGTAGPALAALALVVTAIAAPARMEGLARALARIDEEKTTRPVRPLGSLDGPVFGRWLRDPVERASFRLATVYLRRDRDVRLRIDPSLVTFALVPLAGLVFDEQAGGHLVPLASVCMLGMLPGVVLEALRISSHPAASELFAVAPIPSAASVFHGVRKAALWHVSIAVVVALGLAAAVVPGGIPLAIPGLIAFPTFTLLAGLFGVYVPLARPKARGQQASANAVLLTASTVLLAVLVSWTLRASREGQLGAFYLAELVVVLVVDQLMRRIIARRSLTSPGVSPTYGAG